MTSTTFPLKSFRRLPTKLELIQFFSILYFAGFFFAVYLHQAAVAHGPMGWKAPAKERKVKNPIPKTSESSGRGQKIYADKCASCHGVKGNGQGEMAKALDPQPSDFTDRHMMKEMTDGEIFWKMTAGKGPMPSYQKELTEKERWDLVNYLRSLARPK